MGGAVFGAIAGALAGAGSGMTEVGKQMDLQDNLRLKAELDQQREVLLQSLRNSSAESVANIGAKGSLDVAGVHSKASMYGADTAADAHKVGAETAANATVMSAQLHKEAAKYNADSSSQAHVTAAGIHANASRDVANISAAASAAAHVQVDNNGDAFVVKDGKPQYLTDEDGDKIQSNKDLTPATKALVDGYQKRLQTLEASVNDPSKGMLIRSDPKQLERYTQQARDLQDRIYEALGIDPAAMRPSGPTPTAQGKRPPLSNYVK